MCWMLNLPDGAGIDPGVLTAIDADLRRANEVNNEGGGLCIAVPGSRLVTARSMDFQALLMTWWMLTEKYPHAPATIHLRLATTGVVAEAQCHPMMTPDGRYAVFLNGTLPLPWSEPGLSDTAEFALTLHEMVKWRDDLNEAGDLTSLAPVLGGLIGKHNKMIIMNDDPHQAERVHVINRDQWITTPYGGLASQPDHLGKGVGWDEEYRDGELWRWNIVQPGQCPADGLYHPDPIVHTGILAEWGKPRLRNETERKERVSG